MKRLGRSITDGQASIRLTRADALVADRLGIPTGSPILRLEQVDATALLRQRGRGAGRKDTKRRDDPENCVPETHPGHYVGAPGGAQDEIY